MVAYRGLCPFCHTEHVEFKSQLQWKNKQQDRRALFTCGFCGEAVVRAYTLKPGTNDLDLKQYSGDGSNYGVTLTNQWPAERASDSPPDCPPNVSNFFKQAVKSLSSGSYDAAGIMFRKALEAATKALNANSQAKNLAGRIQELVASHLLTPALGAWANEVRLGGNDAAHDEDPFSKEDAESLHYFTENFLNYAFTMPAAVSRRAAPA